MSQNLTQAKIIKFTDDVQNELKVSKSQIVDVLRSGGMLYKTSVKGDSVNFPVYGSFEMKDRGAHESQILPDNPYIGRKSFTLKNYVSLIQTDVFAQEEVDFDEEKQVVKQIAGAMARSRDKAMIDVLNNVSTTTLKEFTNFDAAYNMAEATLTGMTVEKIRKLQEYYDTFGLPQEGRLLFIDPQSRTQLLREEEFKNFDYNTQKVLQSPGMEHTFLGFRIITVSDNFNESGTKIGGLPLGGASNTTRTNFACLAPCLAGAEADLKVGSIVIQFDIDFACHKILSTLRVGYGVTNARGIVKFQNDISL